jgi:hypothetical protein
MRESSRAPGSYNKSITTFVKFHNFFGCCQSDRPDAAVLETINTQGKNTPVESDKTFHLVVSFPVGEQPDDVILKALETKIWPALVMVNISGCCNKIV